MANIRISQFSGMYPKLGARLLADANAQIANNCKLQSGEIHPINQPGLIYTPNKTLPALSMILARDNSGSTAWMTWPFDVDAVKAPLSLDTESRYYWTGDNEPRFGKYSDIVNGGANNYPAVYFALGIPKPTKKPTATSTGGLSTTQITRFYCYTFFSQYGEESAPSPVSDALTGKIDDTYSIANMDAFPTNSGTGTATYSSGITQFVNASSAPHWLRVGDEIIINSTSCIVYGIVNAYTFTVQGDFSAYTSWARKAPWNTSGMKRRLYRTTGTTGTFQLVNDNVSTTYTDSLTDAQILGDQLISAGWVPPPPQLRGMFVHSSGALGGFYNNQLVFSEPYQPHAWPVKYALSTDYKIVGVVAFGQSVGVATEGNAYIVSGTEPGSLSADKQKPAYPCLSKKSIYASSNGMVYSSSSGLVEVSLSAEPTVITSAYYSKEDWQALMPSNMQCVISNGRVYINSMLGNGSRFTLIFDDPILVNVDLSVNAIYSDDATNNVYLSTSSGIYLFDAPDKAPLTTSWKSKRFIFPNPVNFGAAKVEFATAVDPVALAAILASIAAANATNSALFASGDLSDYYNAVEFNATEFDGTSLVAVPDTPASNTVTFTIYSKGKLVTSRVVSDNKAFRLPAGFKTDDIEIQINSQCIVYEVRVAETMEGLKQI